LKRLFRQIALAVQYLHRQEIAHSDIKPENVILDLEGNAKLIDFGFAKQKQIAGDDEKYGTPIYMPPEFLRNMLIPVSIQTQWIQKPRGLSKC
jgi:serine/threonine protein kinase